MPNTSLDDALKEVYALAPADTVALATLELRHPDLAEPLYIVQDRVGHEFTLESPDGGTTPGDTVFFMPVPCRVTLPSVDAIGSAEMRIAIDNVDNIITDFFDSIGATFSALEVIYRPYLSTSPGAPQMDPPLELYLNDLRVNVFEVSGSATFSNIQNYSNGSQYYNRDRFPGLGG